MAFVTGPSVNARPAFSGAAVRTCSTAPQATVTMSASKPNRRQLLQSAAALVAGIPLAALAKSGDSAKISIFGVGGASSPYVAGIETGGKILYNGFSDEEIALFKRIVNDSKERLVGAEDSIKAKSWEDIRSRIRLEATELRKVVNNITDNLDDKQTKAAATKDSKALKLAFEQLDQACVQKDQTAAKKYYSIAIKNLSAWQDDVGFSS